MANGRRDPTDEKVLLSEVGKFLHAAKARKEVLVNARRTAKKARKAAAGNPAPAARVPASSSSSSKKAVAAGQPQLPAGSVARKVGGSVWITLKCGFNKELRSQRADARDTRGVAKPVFVLPSTNARYRRRQARYESGVAEAADSAQEPEEVEDNADEVQDAPEAEDDAALTSNLAQHLVDTFGTGASKCIVKAKSSLARKLKRKPLPAPESARSGDANVRTQAESAERRRCRRRRVKAQKTTSILSSQKQTATFVQNLIALLRKEVYPQLAKTTAPVTEDSSSAEEPASSKHVDPVAEPKPAAKKVTASNQPGKPQQAQQSQQHSQQAASKKGGSKRK
jgi:hypothetical protein